MVYFNENKPRVREECTLEPMVRILFFLLLSSTAIQINYAYDGSRPVTDSLTRSNRPLSVLLVAPSYAGHVTPFLDLGEELVGRGHNVTLVTGPSDLILMGVEKSKFNLWSIGDETVNA